MQDQGVLWKVLCVSSTLHMSCAALCWGCAITHHCLSEGYSPSAKKGGKMHDKVARVSCFAWVQFNCSGRSSTPSFWLHRFQALQKTNLRSDYYGVQMLWLAPSLTFTSRWMTPKSCRKPFMRKHREEENTEVLIMSLPSLTQLELDAFGSPLRLQLPLIRTPLL